MSSGSHLHDPEILGAMADLWQLRAPGPDDIQKHVAFSRLCDACGKGRSDKGTIGFRFALSSALRSLGLPCGLQGTNARSAMSFEDAASRLEDALGATTTKRIHLAPLDLAEELPEMAFGPARVCRFAPEVLSVLFDEPRLNRFLPNLTLDADRFSEFHWLVVEEVITLDPSPGKRALPVLSVNMGEDFGRIEPHKKRFPKAIEDALFS
jgi:hypothetical protein